MKTLKKPYFPNQDKGRYKVKDYKWSITDGLAGFPPNIWLYKIYEFKNQLINT